MQIEPKDLIIDAYSSHQIVGFLTQDIRGVRITHTPTGISVTKDSERSLLLNRIVAFNELCEAVEKHYKDHGAQIVALEALASPGSPAPGPHIFVKPYGCHNGKRPVAGVQTHYAQAGYSNDVARKPLWIAVKHVMSTGCMYDKQLSDSRCANCKHIRK